MVSSGILAYVRPADVMNNNTLGSIFELNPDKQKHILRKKM